MKAVGLQKLIPFCKGSSEVSFEIKNTTISDGIKNNKNRP